jgi:hypothetical protein
MRTHSIALLIAGLAACASRAPAPEQPAPSQPAPSQPAPSQPVPAAAVTARPDSIRTLVSRLDLASYKETIRGLTQFGDRRQGTARNRAAVDWIEAQLKSYGCTNTERIRYEYQSAQGLSRPHRGQHRFAAPARPRAPPDQRRARHPGPP